MTDQVPPPTFKPKLVKPVSRPVLKHRPGVIKLPSLGSFERLWRLTFIRTAKSPLASWILGSLCLVSFFSIFYGSVILSKKTAFFLSPILDEFSQRHLSSSFGFMNLLGKMPGTSYFLGYVFLLCIILILRWVVWCFVDFPMSLGSAVASSDPHQPKHILPFRLSSFPSFFLHVTAGFGFFLGIYFAGNFDLDAIDSLLNQRIETIIRNNQPSNIKDIQPPPDPAYFAAPPDVGKPTQKNN